MSAVQLGRLARRLLPLSQQLERAGASAAAQQFSSAAEAAGSRSPEAGGSRDTQRGSSSGTRSHSGAPRGDFVRRQQRQHGEGGGSPRQPGAMSQLLARDGRRDWPQQRRGGPGGYGGGYGPPAPGSDESGDFFVEPAGLPPHVRDIIAHTPAELVLGQFGVSLKAAKGKGEADLRDVATDIADLANMDQLPLIKYYMSQQQWRELTSGRMPVEEQNALLDKLAAALLADERSRAKEAAVVAAINSDPDYDLAASLASQPQLRGSPRAPAPATADVAAELEARKEQILAETGMSEEEFEASAAATAQRVAEAAQREAAPVLVDYLKLGRRLTALLDRAMPRDHPNYGAVAQRLAVLQSNPGWPHERKMVFTKRLIKNMTSPDMTA